MSTERLNQLAKKDNLIYVYTRLFDFGEKSKAEETEEVVLDAVNEAFLTALIFTGLVDVITTFILII